MVRYSARREKILQFITEFIEEQGYPPSVREIMKGCNISSPAVVQNHLNTLEKRGQIRRTPEVSRGIQLVKNLEEVVTSEDFIEIPLLGVIAAGEPIPVPGSDTWTVTPDEVYRFPADMLHGAHNAFMVRVKGTSMINDGIHNGDIVIMTPAQTASDGECVAVWLKEEQEVTLKRIYRDYKNKRIRLQPRNETMPPIFTKPENVEIQGKPLYLLRDLRS